jgi:hypothetical protein
MDMLTTRALALMAGNGVMVLKFIETLIDQPMTLAPYRNVMLMFGVSPITGLIASYIMLIAIQRTAIGLPAANVRRGAEIVATGALGLPLIILLFATLYGFG